jgi:2-haloacid dehalogenase
MTAGPRMPIKAIAFDAYGTIFDVHSIGVVGDRLFPGRGAELSALWRVKQIDYTRLRTMSDRYEPFSKITRDALSHAAAALALPLDDERAEALMIEYERLAVFSDSADAIAQLQTSGLPMAILSNGDPPMLEAIVANGGLAGVFDHLLSVDSVGRFKTAPEAYELGPLAFGCEARDILFVSSNCWDACGATWYGYTTFWVNRTGAPLEALGVVPTATGSTMHDVLTFIAARNA